MDKKLKIVLGVVFSLISVLVGLPSPLLTEKAYAQYCKTTSGGLAIASPATARMPTTNRLFVQSLN